MAWTFKNDRPIYFQIADVIKRDIFAGKYAPGDKLPGVRDIAMTAAVNPNTVQHAMNMLEEEGLFSTSGTAGRFVTDDPETLARLRNEFAEAECRRAIAELEAIGLDRDAIMSTVERVLSEQKD